MGRCVGVSTETVVNRFVNYLHRRKMEKTSVIFPFFYGVDNVQIYLQLIILQLIFYKSQWRRIKKQNLFLQ